MTVTGAKNRFELPGGSPSTALVFVLAGVFFFFSFSDIRAQTPEYDMFTGTVYDCDGILYDSGGPDNAYASNENTVFTIASAGTIVLSFTDYFEIEQCCDVIYVYDGPDTGSPLIATLNIDGVIPPAVTATTRFDISDPIVIGVSENTANNAGLLVVYPNPSGSYFSVTSASGQMLNAIWIYDNLGKLVYRSDQPMQKVVVDASHFADGLYTINCTLGGSIAKTRFVKQ